MDKIGFIGAGNMAYAMMMGLVKSGTKQNLIFNDKSIDRKIFIVDTLDIEPVSSNIDVVKDSKYIILAVKPQYVNEVVTEIKDYIKQEHIIISITPLSINTLEKLFDKSVRIVHAMPNTPALVQAGMSVISFSKSDFTDEEKNTVISIFTSFGEVEIMDESCMNAIIPLSGSSPAYIYMLIEAMADAGVRYGIPRKIAYKLASQAVLGSAKMVLETGEHPAKLKDDVCSPGGSTIEAVQSLEKHSFRSTIIEAMNTCYNKAKLLSDKDF